MAKYTVEDGNKVVNFLKIVISNKAKLIGSLGRGKESDNDIDILLPDLKRTAKIKNALFKILDAKKCVNTDWGGLYFYDTRFGNVDIFFTTKDFDY